jgi:hypothetical protein
MSTGECKVIARASRFRFFFLSWVMMTTLVRVYEIMIIPYDWTLSWSIVITFLFFLVILIISCGLFFQARETDVRTTIYKRAVDQNYLLKMKVRIVFVCMCSESLAVHDGDSVYNCYCWVFVDESISLMQPHSWTSEHEWTSILLWRATHRTNRDLLRHLVMFSMKLPRDFQHFLSPWEPWTRRLPVLVSPNVWSTTLCNHTQVNSHCWYQWHMHTHSWTIRIWLKPWRHFGPCLWYSGLFHYSELITLTRCSLSHRRVVRCLERGHCWCYCCCYFL